MTILDELRHCRFGVVVLLCGFAYGCSTPKYTTVREHPEFQESRAQFKSLAVFPPDVAFQHLVFDGDHQSVPEREEAIAHELAALLPGLLAARTNARSYSSMDTLPYASRSCDISNAKSESLSACSSKANSFTS